MVATSRNHRETGPPVEEQNAPDVLVWREVQFGRHPPTLRAAVTHTSSAFNTLNVYSLLLHPLRSTASDYLYSFRRYGSGRQLYLNLAVREVPTGCGRRPVDMVVFQTVLFSQSDGAVPVFQGITERALPLKGAGRCPCRAFPRTSTSRPKQLNRLHERLRPRHTSSPGARVGVAEDLPRRGPRAGRDSTRPAGLSRGRHRGRIERIVARTRERPIDIGYRAWSLASAPWLGRHGILKGEVGERRETGRAPSTGSKVDISSSGLGRPARRRLVPLPRLLQVHARLRGRRQHARLGRLDPRAQRALPGRAPRRLLRGGRGRLLSRRGRKPRLLRDRPPPHRGLRHPHLPGAGRGRLPGDPAPLGALHPGQARLLEPRRGARADPPRRAARGAHRARLPRRDRLGPLHLRARSCARSRRPFRPRLGRPPRSQRRGWR